MSLKDLGEVCASLLGKSIQEPGYNSSCPVLHHHGGPHPRRWDLSEPGSRGCPCWKTAATEHEGHLCESGTLRCCGTVCRDLSVVWLILSQTWHKDLNGQECKQLRFQKTQWKKQKREIAWRLEDSLLTIQYLKQTNKQKNYRPTDFFIINCALSFKI